MTEKPSFVLYIEYLKHIQKLSMEQRGELFTAILCYAAGESIPELDAASDMAFSFIKERMDRDNAVYMEKVEKRREAGKLGGRPKANGFSEKQEKAKKANGFSEKQKNPVNDTDIDTDTVPVTDNNKKQLAPDDESPCAGKILLNDGSEYVITENDVVTYQQLYQGIDVRAELRKMEAWCLSNEKNRKTRSGAKRFFNNWLNRAQDNSKPEKAEKKPEAQPKKNGFNNFPQRQYDYDKLEKLLLNSNHKRDDVNAQRP